MKDLFTYLLLNGFILLFSTCNKVDDVPTPNSFPLISVVDIKGNDLLNPENENAIPTEIIRIYYIRNGKPKLQYNSIGQYAYFYLTKHYDTHIIAIQADISAKETTTLIQWNEHDTDTMICRFNDKSRLTKVIYNNEEKWEDPSGRNEPYFTIIK